MSGNFVSVDIPGGSDLIGLSHCPRCGNDIVFAEAESPPCKHLLFSYLDEVGKFGYPAPQMQGMEEEERSDIYPPEWLIKQVDYGLCIAIGSNALGGGAAAGFDYSMNDD